GTMPDYAELNGTQGTSSWTYSISPGTCKYQCQTGYHTENGGTSCVSDTRSCVIVNGTGEEIWNGSTWGTCTVQSCNSNYIQNGNSCVIDDGSINLGGLKWYSTGVVLGSGSINQISSTSFTYKNDYQGTLLSQNGFISEWITGDYNVSFKINSWQGLSSGFFRIGYMNESGTVYSMSEIASYGSWLSGNAFRRRHIPNYTYINNVHNTNIIYSMQRVGTNNSYKVGTLEGYNTYGGNVRLIIWYFRDSNGLQNATQTVTDFTVTQATPVN
ncbi:MAG: hypothetical protein PHS49_08070, partial [Candidatus Gracilibacteria bacterium]|nr:hypothetical protein [Candidatus Gracilibacteria bacterium]